MSCRRAVRLSSAGGPSICMVASELHTLSRPAVRVVWCGERGGELVDSGCVCVCGVVSSLGGVCVGSGGL